MIKHRNFPMKRTLFLSIYRIICLSLIETQTIRNKSVGLTIASLNQTSFTSIAPIFMNTSSPNSSKLRSIANPITTKIPTTASSQYPITSHSNLLLSRSTTDKIQIQSSLILNDLVDQFNDYRRAEILSHIKTCHPDLSLNSICESYALDNVTHKLVRSSVLPFQTVEQVAFSLIDRLTVNRLRRFCHPGVWCFGNLTQNDIRYPIMTIRDHHRSLCSLDRCNERILTYTNSCPSLIERNISLPTLKLLPLICALSEELQIWSRTACTESLFYLFHLIYAFWPSFHICYRGLVESSNSCPVACRVFIDMFDNVHAQCKIEELISKRLSLTEWHQLINLKELCQQKNISSLPTFIFSMKKFLTSNTVWSRFQEQPVYAVSFILIVISFAISLSLCFHVRSRRSRSSSSQDSSMNNYEYTRLHNNSFELGLSTEIPNSNSFSDRIIDQSNFAENDSTSFSEYHRLLRFGS